MSGAAEPRVAGSADGAARLRGLLADATRVVAFTGAGISTESGIPDFRSPGGVWTRYDPRDFTFDRYVADPEVRARAWEMRRAFLAARPAPNPAHHALVDLERLGRLRAVVTQNIDGLHQAAGSTDVVELHGTALEVGCIGAAPDRGIPAGCGFRASHAWAIGRVDAGDPDPGCPDCGGLVKTATVSFGQVMDEDVLARAQVRVASSDLLLVVGSSLQVYPAAALPDVALRHGARVVIVNDEPTDLDGLATLVVRGRAGEVIPAAIVGVRPAPAG